MARCSIRKIVQNLLGISKSWGGVSSYQRAGLYEGRVDGNTLERHEMMTWRQPRILSWLLLPIHVKNREGFFADTEFKTRKGDGGGEQLKGNGGERKSLYLKWISSRILSITFYYFWQRHSKPCSQNGQNHYLSQPHLIIIQQWID